MMPGNRRRHFLPIGIAREHYLRATEEHFEEVVNPQRDIPTEKATQNPTQQDAELPRKTLQPVGKSAICDKKRSLTTQCEASVGRAGFEPA